MPEQDQYVKMPDNSYVHIPASATPDQLAQFRNKLSASQPNLKTGVGMEAAAHQQATPKRGELPGVSGVPPTGNAGTAERPLVTPKMGESFADTMGRGVKMGQRVTPGQIESATDEAISDVPTVIGAASAPGMLTSLAEGATSGVPGLLKFGRGVIGAGIGAGAGRAAGSPFGKAGEVIGTMAGGALGGGLAAGLERLPATESEVLAGQPGRIKPLPFGIQRFIPERMVPGPSQAELTTAQVRAQPFIGPQRMGEAEFENVHGAKMQDAFDARQKELSDFGRLNKQDAPFSKLPTRMPERTVPPPELGTPQNPGWMSKIPTRMPARMGTTAIPSGDESVAGTRSLVLTPSEAASEEQMQSIAKRRASERGMQFAGGMTPREGRKVPRFPRRMTSEEYPPPREKTSFSDDK